MWSIDPKNLTEMYQFPLVLTSTISFYQDVFLFRQDFVKCFSLSAETIIYTEKRSRTRHVTNIPKGENSKDFELAWNMNSEQWL